MSLDKEYEDYLNQFKKDQDEIDYQKYLSSLDEESGADLSGLEQEVDQQKAVFDQLLREKQAEDNQTVIPMELPPQSNLTPQGNKWVNAPDRRNMSDRDRSAGDIAWERLKDVGSWTADVGETGVDAISQGVTFGLQDEIAGVLGGGNTAVNNMLRGQSPNIVENYKIARDGARSRSKALAKRDPITAFTGELAGSLAGGTALARGTGKLFNITGKSPTIRSGIASGVGQGGLYGFGSSEEEGMELLKDTAKGAGIGGIAGGIGTGIGQLFRPNMQTAQGKVIQEAEDLGFPLSWGEIKNKNPILMGENVLDSTWIKPTLKAVQNRSKIVDEQVIKDSGVKGVKTIEELYDYLSTVNKMKAGGGRSIAKNGTINDASKWTPQSATTPVPGVRQPSINRDVEKAFLNSGSYNLASGKINPGNFAGQLSLMNPTKYGSGGSSSLGKLSRLAGKVNERNKNENKLMTSLMSYLALGTMGASVSGPVGAVAALLSPAIGSMTMKTGSKLANTKNIDKILGQGSISLGNQLQSGDRMDKVDNLLGILGVIKDVAPYAGRAYMGYKAASSLY